MGSRGAYVTEGSQTLVHPSFDLRDHPLLAKQLERRVPFFDEPPLEEGLWNGLARDRTTIGAASCCRSSRTDGCLAGWLASTRHARGRGPSAPRCN